MLTLSGVPVAELMARTLRGGSPDQGCAQGVKVPVRPNRGLGFLPLGTGDTKTSRVLVKTLNKDAKIALTCLPTTVGVDHDGGDP